VGVNITVAVAEGEREGGCEHAGDNQLILLQSSRKPVEMHKTRSRL